MKTNIVKSLFLCLLCLLSCLSFAQQDFQGKAYYKSKTTVDMNNFGGGQMSEERKRMIAERMKNMLEKSYVLTFNKSESIYKEEETLEAPGQGGGRFSMMMSSFSSGDQYKNVKTQEFLQDQEFFGKQFLIKDSLPTLQWVMGGETKQIGNYTCFKATAMKPVTDFDFTRFRRPRNRNNQNAEGTNGNKEGETEEEQPKDMEIVAWYTMQIPVNQGPGEYWGLPGLILEINAGRTTILCSKIVLNPDEKSTIKAPSKGKEVTKEEYESIVKKKTEEMRENFRRGRGGGGNRRG